MEDYSSDSEMDVSAEVERCFTDSEDYNNSADQTFVLLPCNLAGSHSRLPDRFSNEMKQHNVNFAAKNPLFFKDGRLRQLPTKWGYVQSGDHQLVCIDLESQDIVDSKILHQYFAQQNEVDQRSADRQAQQAPECFGNKLFATTSKSNEQKANSRANTEGKFRHGSLKIDYKKNLMVEIDNSDSNKKDTTRKSVHFLPTNETSNPDLFSRKTTKEDAESYSKRKTENNHISQARVSAKPRISTNFWTPKGTTDQPITFDNANDKLSFTLARPPNRSQSRSDISGPVETNLNDGVLHLLVEKIDSIKDKLSHLERNWRTATNASVNKKPNAPDNINGPIETFNQFAEEDLRHSRYVYHENKDDPNQQTYLIDEEGYYTSNILRRSSSGMIAGGIYLQSQPHLQSSIRLSNAYFQDSNNHMGIFPGKQDPAFESNGHDMIHNIMPDQSLRKSNPRSIAKPKTRPSVSIEQLDHDYLSEEQDKALLISPRSQRRGSHFGNAQTTPNRRSTPLYALNSDNTKNLDSSLHRSPQFAPFNEPSNFYNQELRETQDNEYFERPGRFTTSERHLNLQRESVNVRQSARTINSQNRQNLTNKADLLSRSNFKRQSQAHNTRQSTEHIFKDTYGNEMRKASHAERIREYFCILELEKEALQSLQQRIEDLQHSIRAKTVQKRAFKKDVFGAYIGETQNKEKPTSVLKGLEKIYYSIKTDLKDEKKRSLNLQHLLRAKILLLDMIEKRLNEVSLSPETELCILIRRPRDPFRLREVSDDRQRCQSC